METIKKIILFIILVFIFLINGCKLYTSSLIILTVDTGLVPAVTRYLTSIDRELMNLCKTTYNFKDSGIQWNGIKLQTPGKGL